MNRLLLIILISFSYTSISSQSLIEAAITGKSKIVYEKPFKFNIKNGKWDLKYRMESLNEQKSNPNKSNILTDSLIVKELCKKAENQKLKNWSEEELDNIYLAKNTEYLNIKTIKNTLNLTQKSEIKILKKQIRQYNSYKNKWRSFPLSLSRPVYSENKEYALIAFNYGNNGGEIVIYQKIKENWINVGVIEGWAY
ncbi:hypothetical protein DIS18_14465 [Algibacter marinivivus]|uniref:Uncharacterized protein n=1 Tax=Algibacter marinivivus TaxID=2100723 RepID=A0A2U2X121_9FLAO|nr:hypothetical protein [Algibacter marinivivus]PWH81482.1 hypothetical protein DIS18_14465 [Algibacter marinivivus]